MSVVAAAVLVFQAMAVDLPTVQAADPSSAPASSSSADPSAIPGIRAAEPAATVAAVGDSIVGYRATGYRYLPNVARDAGAGFEAFGFDDSGWAPATAAFGSGGACPLQASVATPWAADTDILVRRHVQLPAGSTGVSVGIAVDNDVKVYWNGNLVGSGTHEFCPELDSFVFPVGDGLLRAGDNVLAVRGIDRGDQTLLDITVRGTLPPNVNPDRYLGQGANPHQNDPTGTLQDPVNTYSGNYTHAMTDLALPGRGLAIAVTRTYNSVRSAIDGPLGPGWSHPYGAALRLDPDGTVTFISEDGSAIPFRPDGAGGYAGDPGVLSRLAPVTGGGFTLTRRDGLRYAFDAAGRLTSETDRNGNTLAFTYTGIDLTAITNSAGRTLTLTVDAAHRITALGDPLGRSVTYRYDAGGRLASVTDVRAGITAYTYDAAGRLASITDQNSHVVAANTYDAQGRVASRSTPAGSARRWPTMPPPRRRR